MKKFLWYTLIGSFILSLGSILLIGLIGSNNYFLINIGKVSSFTWIIDLLIVIPTHVAFSKEGEYEWADYFK